MSADESHGKGKVRNIHLVGIGGAGMSGIAEVLHNLGYRVSGSDRKASAVTAQLAAQGMNIREGHAAGNVAGSDVVVFSSAVTGNNVELAAARRQGIPVLSRAEMLAELMRFHHGVAIAGTHGKTTTTSLIASLLADGGLDPTYVIGGLLNRTGSSARLGAGRHLVAEADESDGSFLHLQPVTAVVTNIDCDHLDAYEGSFALLQQKFLEFVHRLPFYGTAVWCLDDPLLRDLRPRFARPALAYGTAARADYQAQALAAQGNRVRFLVRTPDERQGLELESALPGRHNVLNALAAVAVAHHLGVPMETIAHSLRHFQGIARRCQVCGPLDIGGRKVLLIDDYAHHPVEIQATAEAVRQGWPGRRIVAVFQPHRYTRTQALFESFVRVLSLLEAVVLLDVYSAGEAAIPGADSASLYRALQLLGRNVPLYVGDRSELPEALPATIADGDVLLILGAGDISALAGELQGRFRAQDGGQGRADE